MFKNILFFGTKTPLDPEKGRLLCVNIKIFIEKHINSYTSDINVLEYMGLKDFLGSYNTVKGVVAMVKTHLATVAKDAFFSQHFNRISSAYYKLPLYQI